MARPAPAHHPEASRGGAAAGARGFDGDAPGVGAQEALDPRARPARAPHYSATSVASALRRSGARQAASLVSRARTVAPGP